MATNKNTQRIDRLSNSKLYLGLKTGAYLEVLNGHLYSNTMLTYANAFSADSFIDDNDIPNVGYVQEILSIAKAYSDAMFANRLKAGTRISITTDGEDVNKTYTVGLGYAYSADFINSFSNFETNENSSLKGVKYGVFTGQTSNYGAFNATQGENNAGSGALISAIKVDEYGAVIGVDYKRVSASDLDNSSATYDNYRAWKLSVAGGETVYVSGAGNSNSSDSFDATKTYGLNDTVEFGVSNKALAATYSIDGTTNQIQYGLRYDSDYFEVEDSKGLTLSPIRADGQALASTARILKATVDRYGRVTGVEDVSASDLSASIGVYDGSTNTTGVVSKNSGGETATTSTLFYTNSGKWATIPYNQVKTSTTTENKDISIALVDGNDITAIKTASGISVNPSTGTITAKKISAEVDATKLSGTIPSTTLPIVPISKGGLGDGLLEKDGSTYSQIDGTYTLVYTKSSTDVNGSITPITVDTNSYGITDGDKFVLTQEYSSGKTSYQSVNALVKDVLGDVDAMVFKGTVGVTDSGATQIVGNANTAVNLHDFLTTSKGIYYQAGYTYKAVSDLILTDYDASNNEIKYIVEPGDIILAIRDYNSSENPKFNIIQENIDGAVVSTGSTTSENEIAVFADTTGKSIKGSGLKLVNGALEGTIEKAKQLANKVQIWGNDFDGTEALTSANTIESGHIVPASYSENTLFNIGSEDVPYGNIYAKTFHGDITGNADTATEAAKVKSSLTFGTKTFDGSEAQTILLSDLDGISNVSIPGKSDTEYGVISSITSAKNNGVITITPTYQSVIKSLAFDLFNVSNDSKGNYTIAPYTSTRAGSFYLENSKLTYGSDFVSNKLYVKNSNASTQNNLVEVLSAIPVSSTDKNTYFLNDAQENKKNIIIADYDDSTATYKTVASNINISTSSDSDGFDIDTTVPTAAKVGNYVTNKINALSARTIKSTTLEFYQDTASNEGGNLVSATSSSFFSTGALIRKITVALDAPVSGDTHPGLQIITTDSNSYTLMSSDENDVTGSAGDLYTSEVNYIFVSNGGIKAVLTSADSSSVNGTLRALVYIDYISAN